ncbi:hypothetical protein BSKO_12468 [Bryopsis sp. KO-2023]|nr:hypothetical protein BSKO_12468 [Bryopsis sp. KO-2023]
MSNLLFLLRFIAFLATPLIVYSQDDPNAELCTVPVSIPAEDNFQLRLLPPPGQEALETLVPLSKDQALSNLSQDYLDSEIIQDLADVSSGFFEASSNFFTLASEFLQLSSLSVCDVPPTQACQVQRCGCSTPAVVPGRRRLLQCFPLFGCVASVPGGETSQAVSVDAILISFCIKEKCTTFRIEFPNGAFLNFRDDGTCPGILGPPGIPIPPGNLEPPGNLGPLGDLPGPGQFPGTNGGGRQQMRGDMAGQRFNGTGNPAQPSGGNRGK